MKIYFILLVGLIPLLATAQPELQIFYEKNNQGFVMYAANAGYCPITISLDITRENLKFSAGEEKIFVVPEKTAKWKIGELEIMNTREKSRFSYVYRSNYGDMSITKYDTDYEYSLPYKKGKAFLLSQGYNGRFTHQGENSLDFTMPEGTEILAAREGIVIQVVQTNMTSCPWKECGEFNNYVSIYQPDGTIANYVHIKYSGAVAKVGDTVKKGDLIAYSGNTGCSTGPHLHFECLLPAMEGKNTVTTKFKIDDGGTLAFLHEKELYKKDY